MNDKVQKIREEVERLKSNLLYGACSSQVAMETRCKEEAYNEVLSILDTMQEEPVSIWHDASETPSIFGTYLLIHEDGWCVARYYGKDVPIGNITGWVEISQNIFIEKPKKWLDLREILPKTK